MIRRNLSSPGIFFGKNNLFQNLLLQINQLGATGCRHIHQTFELFSCKRMLFAGCLNLYKLTAVCDNKI